MSSELLKQIGTTLVVRFVADKVFGGKAANVITYGMLGLGAMYVFGSMKTKEINAIEAQYGIRQNLLVKILQTVGSDYFGGSAEKIAKELKRLYEKYKDWDKTCAAFYLTEQKFDAILKNSPSTWQTQIGNSARAFLDVVVWGA